MTRPPPPKHKVFLGGARAELRCCPQELLREVQTLRDQLCTEDEVSSYSIAQKLLQVYRQLRNPSLVLL